MPAKLLDGRNEEHSKVVLFFHFSLDVRENIDCNLARNILAATGRYYGNVPPVAILAYAVANNLEREAPVDSMKPLVDQAN